MNWGWIAWALFIGTYSLAQSPPAFEDAVACIKRFEGLHGPEHYPYVGFGHRLIQGEQLKLPLTEGEADSLLRSDLRKLCTVFQRFGQDALLLATLSYNVGQYALLGHGKRPKSHLIRKLEAGCRDIRKEYLSFRMYRGKVVKSLEERRECEFELLFIPIKQKENETKYMRTNSPFRGIKTNGPGKTGWIPGIHHGRPCFIRPPD